VLRYISLMLMPPSSRHCTTECYTCYNDPNDVRSAPIAVQGYLQSDQSYVTQSILSEPSASGCFPFGFGGGKGFAFGRSSIVNRMTRRKAESAATDFRMLSHLTLSMSVRRSLSSIIALFISSSIWMSCFFISALDSFFRLSSSSGSHA